MFPPKLIFQTRAFITALQEPPSWRGGEGKARFQASLDGLKVKRLKACERKPWTISPGKLILEKDENSRD